MLYPECSSISTSIILTLPGLLIENYASYFIFIIGKKMDVVKTNQSYIQETKHPRELLGNQVYNITKTADTAALDFFFVFVCLEVYSHKQALTLDILYNVNVVQISSIFSSQYKNKYGIPLLFWVRPHLQYKLEATPTYKWAEIRILRSSGHIKSYLNDNDQALAFEVLGKRRFTIVNLFFRVSILIEEPLGTLYFPSPRISQVRCRY